jgi:hypothetical protein
MGTQGGTRRRKVPRQIRNGSVFTSVLVDSVHSWLACARALSTMSAFSGTTPLSQTNEMYAIARSNEELLAMICTPVIYVRRNMLLWSLKHASVIY